MKTLLVVTGGLGQGGAERIVTFISNDFAKRGWKVVLMPLLEKEGFVPFLKLEESIEVIYCCKDFEPRKSKIKALPMWISSLRKAFKQYQPDSIFAITFKIGAIIRLASKKYLKKTTIREINNPKSVVRNQMIQKLSMNMCKHAKGYIFQTEYQKSCYATTIQEKGQVIYNPLTINVDKAGKYNRKVFFTLTRLDLIHKRHDILISAFEKFWNNHNDYTLEIYGEGEDEDKIIELINSSKCKENIKLLKPLKDVHKEIIDDKAFILTSDFEGMSNALIECYSLGIPCITSNWDGVESIITNDVDGIIYQRQEVNQLVNAMERIIDKQTAQRLSENALKNSSKFDKDIILDKYFNIITR